MTFEAETNLRGGDAPCQRSIQTDTSLTETETSLRSNAPEKSNPNSALNPAQEEDKFYMGWAIKIAQTSTFQQAAEHLKQFEIEARQQLKPRGQPMPEVIIPPAQSLSSTQDKLCAEWANDDGRWTTQNNVELNLRRFLREALREPAPEAGIGQPYTEQLERDNAELRRKLKQLQDIRAVWFEAKSRHARQNEDKARLDWLEQTPFMAYRNTESNHYTVVNETLPERRGIVKATLREAIDAARKHEA